MRHRPAWLFVMLTACLPPATLRDPNQSPPSPTPVFVEREAEVEPPPAREVVEGIQPGDCPGRVADFPSPYFGDQVLIRLPSGVTEANFVEFSPSFARVSGPVESDHCEAGMPGPVIRYMAMALLDEQPQPDRPLEEIRDEVLVAFGYPETIVLVEREASTWVYEVPATDAAPDPAKMLLTMIVAHGRTLALVFEVHPNAWTAVVDTLVASAKRVSVLQP